MGGAPVAYGIEDDVVATQEHFITESAFVELPAGGILHSLIAILCIDNACAHTGSSLNLESVAC